MSREGSTLHRIRIEASLAAQPLVETGLALAGIDCAFWNDSTSDRACFDIYLPSPETARETADQLYQCLPAWLAGERFALAVDTIPDEDWAVSWKKHFHVARVSDRIIIKPSWEQIVTNGDDCVVELDPGMGFGTGQHPTTRACLCFIDSIADHTKDHEFLDIGCGSGILSIAAGKLGFRQVFAFDHDSQAIESARDNIAGNELESLVVCSEMDLADWSPKQTYGVVAANLVMNPLMTFSNAIACAVSDGGYLVVAGLLLHQYDQVLKRYIELGCSEIRSLKDGEWKSGLLKKGSC